MMLMNHLYDRIYFVAVVRRRPLASVSSPTTVLRGSSTCARCCEYLTPSVTTTSAFRLPTPSILLLRSFPYLGSAHRVFDLHVLRSCASSICTCFSFMAFLITSLHLSFGRPFDVHPLPCSHYYIFFSLSLHMA